MNIRLTVLDWLVERGRVFRALVGRELLTRYGRHNIGFLWLIGEPVLFSVAIAALWSLIKAPINPGMSVIGFAITGYATVLLWRNAATRASNAMHANWALLYHACIDPFDIYFARIVIELLSASAGMIALSALFVTFGYVQPIHDIVGVILGWFSMMIFAVGFALTVGALANMSETFERIWHMLAYLLFPVSGPAFLVSWLPIEVRDAALWIPMVHGTEWLRGAWFGPAIQTYENPFYLLSSALVFLLVGLALIRRQGRRIEVPA